jgi:DNA-binding transcriptional LysR family regulator
MNLFLSMRIFCTVAEQRSFSAAALKHDIAHSAVSRHVAFLEEHLSARLLNRSSRRVALTEVGASYFEQAKRLVDSLDEIEAGVRGTSVKPSGVLKVSAPPWLANGDFLSLLAEYRRAYPDVKLDIAIDLAEFGAFREYGDLDIALRLTNTPDEERVAQHLTTITFRLVATPAFLDEQGRPVSPDDVNGWPLLHYSGYAPDASVVLRSGHHITFRPVLRSSSTEFLYQALCAGMGPAFMPSPMIADDVAKGRLEYVLPEETASLMKLYAIYPRRPHASAKVTSFVKFLATAFRRRARQ